MLRYSPAPLYRARDCRCRRCRDSAPAGRRHAGNPSSPRARPVGCDGRECNLRRSLADRGKDGTRMFEKKGLMYSLLDKGNKVGVPIKASAVYGTPTLKNLEHKFEHNKENRKPYRIPLRIAIDKILSRQELTKEAFVQLLRKQNINVVFRENDQGLTYGLTFIDHHNKTVFNGSDLGKAYGAKAITDRLTGLTKPDSFSIQPMLLQTKQEKSEQGDSVLEETIKDLTTAKQFDYSSPDAAMKRRKRKKRKGRSI